MVRSEVSRVRIAALILSCVGMVLAASASQVHAQTAASREAPADALARYMRTLAGSPRSFEALVGAGRAALALGDTHAAAGFFGRAEEVHPVSPLPHVGMGAAMVIDGDAAAALPYFARAQQLGANGAMLGNDRGLAFDLLGRHADAQADYRAAMYGPDPDEARRRLSLSLAITGDKEGALAQLAPLMARGDAGAARTRALVLALSGDADGARRSIEAAMPGAAGQMDPFLRRLPALNSGQKAAAVNLGIFPNSGQSTLAGAVPPPPAGGTAARTGDRLSSVEQLLRSPLPQPGAGAPAVQQPVVQGAATPPQLASRQVPQLTTQPVQTARPGPATSVAIRPANAQPVGTAAQAGQAKIWLQLASGANAAALPAQFQRLKLRHEELFEGISGYVADGPDRARLLIGPFKSSRDAEIFAQDLATVRVDAFSWTNPPGQAIRKIGSE